MAQEYKLKGVTSLSIKPGQKQEVEVEGIQDAKVLLVGLQTGGKAEVQAIGARCTHYGAPLVKGILTSTGRLTCPWHGACFHAKTGDVEDSPALDALPVFPLTERDGGFYITAEEAAIKSSRRKPNFKCSVSADAKERVVVVGGGSGALGVVEGLREKGYTGHITVISKEGYLPIDRPKLSKALLTDAAKLAWRDKSWFDSGSVEWVDGEVNDVDFNGRQVTTASGSKFVYTKLVLATGGTPRALPLQGFNVLNNIFTLRTVHDAKKIVDAIGEKGKKIVIIGSSFIGMEIANATGGDNSVTVVGMEKVPLERVLGEQVGAGIQKSLEGKGIKFYMSAGVDRAEPSNSDPSKVGAVYLKDGTKLDADLVILGVGVSPETTYLRNNKAVQLEQDGSLQTDSHFAVNGLTDVYAVGDIATYPYYGPGGNGKPVRIEHWNVAQNAGRAVASHIVDPSLNSQQFIPVFWSALGAQLRYSGNTIASGWDDLIVDGDVAAANFLAYYTKGETVVAVASMGRDPAVIQLAELLKLGRAPTKSQVQQGVDIFSIDVTA
ncbi:pyridine nucleotide-disulfide oxidoreductase, fad nadp-binding domain [Trichoderma arundinaceum]|uniref:Pyridine nucleotide-disulfide oxidoreductase, fad nadp-binding domain n=1 Tax=Trichoderma arundinaceum TaxID=490622 RepID=A0A395NQJ4_TRIAR|nr:pyridine nucleotide-disulfide oxidoreductase, fad nadp-binding domain [Trichoderma arundinaceum]